MNELLPCPFCGGEAELRHAIFCGYDSQWVECTNRKKCGAKVEPVTDVPEVAIAAWNTRAERTCRVTFKRGAMYDVAHYSCCGYEFPESVSETSVAENYCPNCGARVKN